MYNDLLYYFSKNLELFVPHPMIPNAKMAL